MADIRVQNHEVPVERVRNSSKRYYLVLKFETPETDEDKISRYRAKLGSLISGLDLASTMFTIDDLNKDYASKIEQNDGRLQYPRTRSHITKALLQIAVDEAVGRVGEDITNVTGIEVEERETVQRTPFEWGEDDDE